MADRLDRPWRPRAQPEGRLARPAAGRAHRLHRACPGRASPAWPSTRSSPRASAATSESLSAYARQFLGQMDKPDVDFIEGLSPGGLDRPEVHLAQPALDRGHDHRGLRLPAAAVRPDRQAALPDLRRADRAADPAADRRPGAGAATRAPGSRCWPRWSAAARASTSSCSRELQTKGYSRARVDGDGRPAGRAADAEEAGEAHHRGGRRPAGGQGLAPSGG